MSAAPKDEVRCEFTYSDGRRCRRLRVAADAPFCRFHMRKFEQAEAVDRAGDEILAAKDSLNTEDGIQKALGNVFRLLAHNRITARNAAVLGYLGQLMMSKCPSLERTLRSNLPVLQFAMKERQQIDRSQAYADRHERHLLELQFDMLDRILQMVNSDHLKELPLEERREISEAIAAALKKGKAASAEAQATSA